MKLGRVVVASALLAVDALAIDCSTATSSPSADGGGDAAAGDARGRTDGPGDDRPDGPSYGDGGGAPFLRELAVSGVSADGGVYTLVPAFSSDVYDYYVRCSAGTNALSVSVTASPFAEAGLLKPTPSPLASAQTIAVDVAEGAAIVAVAASGSATTQYWVRCLPQDFPDIGWSPHPEAGAPTPGYYLVGVNNLPSIGAYAMVLDAHGVPVWYFEGTADIFNVDEVVPGSLSFTADPAYHYRLQALLPPKATVLPAFTEDEHELRALDGGDFLLVATVPEDGVNLTGLSAPLPDGGVKHLGKDSILGDCVLYEIDPTGTIVWSWRASEHFDPVTSSTWPVLEPAPDGGFVVEAYHCNSIDVDPANGDLLVSARDMDSVFSIDRATGKVAWKLGGNDSCKDLATFAQVQAPSGRFYRQHDARLAPGWIATCGGGHGQITLFDDESYRSDPARGVIYDVDIHPGADSGACPGAEAGTSGATVAWQYAGSGPAEDEGSFRVLSDGSRVVGWGAAPKPGHVTFTEVDEAGSDRLDFTMDLHKTTWSYRAIKVPLGALDLAALRSTSGGSL